MPLYKNTSDRTVSPPAIHILLALSGFSFLFFAGFPFANHNESYAWLPLLDNMSFIESVTDRLGPVQSFRPLGTATAWLTYNLSNGIYVQQFINWLFAAASFAVLLRYAQNKPLFSIAALLATSGFFSGYIYLFHLHGVFYGPLQLYIAVLTGIAYTHKPATLKKTSLLFVITILAAFYHTFALLVFVAYLFGCMLQLRKTEWRIRLPLLIAFAGLSLLAMYLILAMYKSKADGDIIQGTLTSFKTTELNLPLRLLAAAFIFLTAFTTDLAYKTKRLYAVACVLLAALCLYYSIPLLLLWIAACIIKMMVAREWALAGIIFSTAIFPAATHTGTPTYVVFVIMVCTFATTLHSNFLLPAPRFFKSGAAVFAFVLVAVLFCLKAGIKLPGLANALNPILAEQEKTHQLEKIIEWKKSTAPYVNKKISFLDESAKPSASANATSRKHRPPTQQKYLDRYLFANRPTPDTSGTPLLITFGSKKISGRKPVFEVSGTWNGRAYVY